ncbi:MAG: cytochrome c oxidase subunit II [Planctomycetia bacterium]|nr:cytochrome c oxidase subunit II [Planctomycetia bacterium]
MLLADDCTTENLSIFDPVSPHARAIANLSNLVFAVTGLIFIVVCGILLYSLWRFRSRPDDPSTEPAQVYGSQPIEVAWTVAPALIVFFLVLITTRTLWDVNADPPLPHPNDGALFVTVVGRQWWWEYRYETYDGRPLGFVTANELHIPASEPGTERPVYLKLESADVCHSFWVPRLAGKVDLIPGRTNRLTLVAEEQGTYLGQCAEYCGTQHANMLIRVVAQNPADFDSWLANQSLPAREDPAMSEGKQAFLAQSCINCHRVRGTPAQGGYAPDLTHLMSRQTLASGQIKNTPEDLNHWVRDPQQIKPGSLMPAFGLPTRDHDLIVRYLNSLH